MKKKKRSLAFLLSLSMVMSTFSGITVWADDGSGADTTQKFQFVQYNGLENGGALPDAAVTSSDYQWISAQKSGGSSYIAICDVEQSSEEENWSVVKDSGVTTNDFDLYLTESWCEENQLSDGENERKIDDKATYLTDVSGQAGVIRCTFPAGALGSYELRCTKAGYSDLKLRLDVNYTGNVDLYEKDTPGSDAVYQGENIHAAGSTIYLMQLETDLVTYSAPVVSVKEAGEEANYTSDPAVVSKYVSYDLDTAVKSGSFYYSENGPEVVTGSTTEEAHSWSSYAIRIQPNCPNDFELKVAYTAQEKDSEGTYTRSCSQYVRTKGEIGFFATEADAKTLGSENAADQIGHLIYLDDQTTSFYYAVEGENTNTFQLVFEGDENPQKTEIIDLLGENQYFTSKQVQSAGASGRFNIYQLTLKPDRFSSKGENGPLNLELNVLDLGDPRMSLYISWDDGLNDFVFVEQDDDGNYYKRGRGLNVSPVTEKVKSQTITIADFDPDTGNATKTYGIKDIDIYRRVENWETGEPVVSYDKCDELKNSMTEAGGSITCAFSYKDIGEYRICKAGENQPADGLKIDVFFEYNDVVFYGDEGKNIEWGTGDYEEGAYGDLIYVGLGQDEYSQNYTFEITGTRIHVGEDYVTSPEDVQKYVTFDQDKNAYQIKTYDQSFGLCVTAKITAVSGENQGDAWTIESEADVWITPTGIVFVYPQDNGDSHRFPADCDWGDKEVEMTEYESMHHLMLAWRTKDGKMTVIDEDPSKFTCTGGLKVKKCEDNVKGCYELISQSAGKATLTYEGQTLTVTVKPSMVTYATDQNFSNRLTPEYDEKDNVYKYDCWKPTKITTIYVKVTPPAGEEFSKWDAADTEGPVNVFAEEGFRGAKVETVDSASHIYKVTLPTGYGYDGRIIVEASTRKTDDPLYQWKEVRALNVYAQGNNRPVISDNKEGQGYCGELMTEEEYLNGQIAETSFDDNPNPLIYFHAATMQGLIEQAEQSAYRKNYADLNYLHITLDPAADQADTLSQTEQVIKSSGNLKGILIDAAPVLVDEAAETYQDVAAPKINLNADVDYRLMGHLTDVRVLMSKETDNTITVCEPKWALSGDLIVVEKASYTKQDMGSSDDKTIRISGLTYDDGKQLTTLPAFPLRLYTQKVELKTSGTFVKDKDSVSITEETKPDISTVKDVELTEDQMKAIANSGASVKIDLVVDTVENPAAGSDAKKAIDAIENEVKIDPDYKVNSMTAIDVNLETTVEDKDGTKVKFDGNVDNKKITEVDEPIEITIQYPGEMDPGFGYDIFRYHGKTVEIIKAIINRAKKTLTFRSDKFSVYGIVPKALKTIDDAEKATLTTAIANVETASKADANAKKAYDGKAKTFTIVDTDLPEGMTVSYTGTCTATEPGNYTAKVTFKLNENYYDTSALSDADRTALEKTISIPWSITGKKTLNINEILSKVSWNYSTAFTENGNTHTVKLDISKLGDGFTVAYTGTQTASKAGSYLVTAKIGYDTDKYNSLSAAQENQLYLDLEWEIKAASSGGSSSGGASSGGASSGGASSGGASSGGTSSGDKKPIDTRTTEETWADKTRVVTRTETAADGTVTKTITATSADGKHVVSLETRTDAKGNELASKMEISQISSGRTNRFDLSTAEKLLADTKSDTQISLIARTASGKTAYEITVSRSDLAAGAKLYVYKVANDGSLVMVGRKANTVKAGKLALITKLAAKGNYQLVNKKQAAKINQKILRTVKAAKTSAVVNAGDRIAFQLSKKLNKANLAKITYTSSNPKIATVSKKGIIKAIQAGTVTIRATITLNNGTKKVVKMTIRVK